MSRPKGCLFAIVIALALISILGALGYLSFSRQLDQTIQSIRDKG